MYCNGVYVMQTLNASVSLYSELVRWTFKTQQRPFAGSSSSCASPVVCTFTVEVISDL